MNLNIKINGKVYDKNMIQGITISEEYNETLDSCVVVLSQIKTIDDFYPYDDVFIYEGDFIGYNSGEYFEYKIGYSVSDTEKIITIPNEMMKRIIENPNKKNGIGLYVDKDPTNINYRTTFTIKNIQNVYYLVTDENVKIPIIFENGEYKVKITQEYQDEFTQKFDIIGGYVEKFFKHFLLDEKTKEQLNLEEDLNKYSLELFSETKRLETIQIPNFSITEPLFYNLKINAFDYMKSIIEMYSPVYKYAYDEINQKWIYKRKYTLDKSLKNIFGNTFVPDFTLNNPNLRDLLSKIMIIKDRIPIVENDLIKAMDITERKKSFEKDSRFVNFITENITSQNYCNSLKRSYNNALSQENTSRVTEFIGFRNSTNSLLTFDNLRIETRFPIYKINTIYACYYKKIKIKNKATNDLVSEKIFLCKQDISPLVKLNVERNVLSQDWTDFEDNVTSIEKLSKYKFATVGYDIGSKYIEGWGTKYTYFDWWTIFSHEKTYLENIIDFMDSNYPIGIYDYEYIKDLANITDDEYLDINFSSSSATNKIINPFSFGTPKYKGIIFQINYNAFYNGTVIHSKDETFRDDIIINDNPGESLTLLEQDGIFQKEKLNRYGNEVYQINARYTNYMQLQELGSVLDNDVIIYHREYSIFDNFILCKYIGSKNYVLKNYFTSVYAKHRPYTLMNYEESINRPENKKVFILLSKNNKYYEKYNDDNNTFNLTKFISNPEETILSFFKNTKIDENVKNFVFDDKINYAYLECNSPIYAEDNETITGYQKKKYSSDVNGFVSGNSLCFNLSAYDNVSAGVYIDPDKYEASSRLLNVENDVVGSLQRWYLTTDDINTGFLEKIGFYIGHIDREQFAIDEITIESNVNNIYKKIFSFPKIDIDEQNIKNLIGKEYLIRKDNKEILDMTFQFEPLSDNGDIIFSPWMMKLSDLNGNYAKSSTNKAISNSKDFGNFQLFYTDFYGDNYSFLLDKKTYSPAILLRFKKDSDIKKIVTNLNYGFSIVFDVLAFSSASENDIVKLEYGFVQEYGQGVKYESDKRFSIPMDVEVTQYHSGGNTSLVTLKEIVFDKIDTPIPKNYYFEGLFGKDDALTNGYTWYIANYCDLLKLFNDDYIDVGFPYYKNTLTIKEDDATKEINYISCTSNGKYLEYNAPRQLETRVAYCKFLKNEYINDANADNFYIFKESLQTFNKNMFIIESEKKINKTIIYEQYNQINSSNANVSNVFKFETNVATQLTNLKIDLTQLENSDLTNVNSIQLWYMDENGSYHFVFGVNLAQEEKNNKIVEIKISFLSHKDKRVFDKLQNIIGEMKKVVDSNDLNVQKYEKIS